MHYIHSREYLNQGDSVRLDCDTQCNFMITDDSNFALFKRGEAFTYYGGHFEVLPATVVAPHPGNWNITIDLAGGFAEIKYSLSVLKA
jgi:hypothetical protein